MKTDQKSLKKIRYGVIKFAWLPTRLRNGKWIWFRTFFRKYDITEEDGELVLWSADPNSFLPMYHDFKDKHEYLMAKLIG